ncbi:phosphatidylinositol 4,5-bisphosphate-binding protein [Sporothrix bragantina]|uniref:Phosphatidylinositol 4,5-bisphosphate-binding protein n=1 Tax=Sporothrix bragantina TaxID=671064 RepID=A0ABP0AT14_9PEZI
MASTKSPLLSAAQGPASGSVVGSAPTISGPTVGHSSSGYFNQQPYLQTPSQHQSQQQHPHSYAGQSHLPARSPYTDSQNFMPSSLPAEDDQTYLNTLANAQGASASQTNLPSSTVATGGRNSPFQGSRYYNGNSNSYDGASEVGAAGSSILGASAMASSYNHGAGAASTNGRFAENWDASQRGSSIVDGEGGGGAYSDGGVSGTSTQLPTRGNTLKKKSSLRRGNSLHRSGSRRSMKAGSVRSLALQSRSDADESQSAFYCPVPTRGNPTELLANRFQAWRKILKDLIAYHREIQNHYEQRAKSLQRLAASLNGSNLPPGFMQTGGLDDASSLLHGFHKQAVSEAIKAREIEEDVILALTGLRTDLSQKIKEIKNISGDFRNNVDKEMDATKKAVKNLQDNLGQAEVDSSLTTGRQDPYLLRLMADRQLERQIQEENYLHQAFLNLEKSGRELESIVVGEIQKSYNAYVGILRREVGTITTTVDELREGPIAMPKDQEWMAFVRNNDQFIGPDVPIRSFQFITYPGQHHFACQEIRAGLLERKSKYLKSYTAGWYVLSPTHLHEFKSADKMQAPVMSLYLPEQKLGSHSTENASSSKFVLKGRQTGGLHRGHTWVFRAESYDTMMAWYDDLYALTEKTPQEREEFARGHQRARSTSRASQHTYSSDGVNEEDDEPFAVNSPAALAGTAAGIKAAEDVTGDPLTHQTSVVSDPVTGATRTLSPDGQGRSQSQSAALPARRPSQGGRFPSDLQVNAQRGLEVQAAGIPISPTSAGGSGSQQGSTDLGLGPSGTPGTQGPGSDYGVIAAAGALPGSHQAALDPNSNYNSNQSDYGYPDQLAQQQYQQQYQQPQQAQQPQQYQQPQQAQQAQYVQPAYQQASYQQAPYQQPQQAASYQQPAYQQTQYQQQPPPLQQQYSSSNNANTLAAVGAGGVVGAAGAHYYHQQKQQQQQAKEEPTTSQANQVNGVVPQADQTQTQTPAAAVTAATSAGPESTTRAISSPSPAVVAAPSSTAAVIPMFVDINEKTPSATDSAKVMMGDERESAPPIVNGFAQTNGTTKVDGVTVDGVVGKSPAADGAAAPLSTDRPDLTSSRKKSDATTLSHLHIPGEYPRTPAV